MAAAQANGDFRSEVIAIATEVAIELNRSNHGVAMQGSARGLAVARELGKWRFEVEAEALLARGCASHNHLEVRWHAIQVCIADGDAAGVLRHAVATAEYTRDERLT